MRFSTYACAATLCTLAGQGANAAITLDLTSIPSIKKAADIVAFDLMTYYTGNNTGDTPGNLPDPYYWWECGAMFGTMINYWYYTGDTTYNDVTQQALLHQAGDEGNFMPDNQTKTLGNDDQGFWGMAAMTAAETKFQDPPAPSPGWLALAQGVYNTQVVRFDNATCGGGFRWQIFSFNQGFSYKNSISNGCFFNLAARLALYTGNATYAAQAVKVFDWTHDIGLITPDYGEVFDGAQITDNCTSKDQTKWTYNVGIFLLGSAAMYNYTNGSEIWKSRVEGFIKASDAFHIDGVMYEGCEKSTKPCNVDQRSFKAYLTRCLAATVELAPFTHDLVMKQIRTSAEAAIKTCTAGNTGTQCGLKWTTGVNDGSLGVGEQMAVLEAVQSNLVDMAPGWVSSAKGTGTSEGNVNQGSEHVDNEDSISDKKVTTGGRVGAGLLTVLICVAVVSGTAGMIM